MKTPRCILKDAFYSLVPTAACCHFSGSQRCRALATCGCVRCHACVRRKCGRVWRSPCIGSCGPEPGAVEPPSGTGVHRHAGGGVRGCGAGACVHGFKHFMVHDVCEHACMGPGGIQLLDDSVERFYLCPYTYSYSYSCLYSCSPCKARPLIPRRLAVCWD